MIGLLRHLSNIIADKVYETTSHKPIGPVFKTTIYRALDNLNSTSTRSGFAPLGSPESDTGFRWASHEVANSISKAKDIVVEIYPFYVPVFSGRDEKYQVWQGVGDPVSYYPFARDSATTASVAVAPKFVPTDDLLSSACADARVNVRVRVPPGEIKNWGIPLSNPAPVLLTMIYQTPDIRDIFKKLSIERVECTYSHDDPPGLVVTVIIIYFEAGKHVKESMATLSSPGETIGILHGRLLGPCTYNVLFAQAQESKETMVNVTNTGKNQLFPLLDLYAHLDSPSGSNQAMDLNMTHDATNIRMQIDNHGEDEGQTHVDRQEPEGSSSSSLSAPDPANQRKTKANSEPAEASPAKVSNYLPRVRVLV